ncbi:acyltransferase family protein [Exilibacterium tricleocarpae]|nr:acyltransferase family protein [Exilibacterium tricleocarpae]
MGTNKDASGSDHIGQRLHGLDFLRAVMMSLGVVLHSAQLYLTMDMVDYYRDPMRSVSMDLTLIFINTFRMPTFYLLSGFFTALLLARRGPDRMFRNRYQRLVIPFILFLPPLAISMTLLRIVAANVMATGDFGLDINLIDRPRILWDNTHNLWFLYYLIMYVVSVWLALQLCRYLPDDFCAHIRRWTARTPAYSIVAIFTVSLSLAAIGSFSEAGRITGKLSFMPSISVYLYFGICFLTGWVLFQRREDITVLARRGWGYMTAACFFLVVALVCFELQGKSDAAGYQLFHTLLSVSTGLSVCFFMLAFVGLFCRYFHRHQPWIRYFSDSAYWVFISHSVPMILLALPMHSWEVVAEIKFLLVCSGTMLVCMLTYHRWVRNTRIGEILNGRRYGTLPKPP